MEIFELKIIPENKTFTGWAYQQIRKLRRNISILKYRSIQTLQTKAQTG